MILRSRGKKGGHHPDWAGPAAEALLQMLSACRAALLKVLSGLRILLSMGCAAVASNKQDKMTASPRTPNGDAAGGGLLLAGRTRSCRRWTAPTSTTAPTRTRAT